MVLNRINLLSSISINVFCLKTETEASVTATRRSHWAHGVREGNELTLRYESAPYVLSHQAAKRQWCDNGIVYRFLDWCTFAFIRCHFICQFRWSREKRLEARLLFSALIDLRMRCIETNQYSFFVGATVFKKLKQICLNCVHFYQIVLKILWLIKNFLMHFFNQNISFYTVLNWNTFVYKTRTPLSHHRTGHLDW